jgi:hypothetical protein
MGIGQRGCLVLQVLSVHGLVVLHDVGIRIALRRIQRLRHKVECELTLVDHAFAHQHGVV